MSTHRKPMIPFSNAPRGQCRWCGEPILKSDGTVAKAYRWHQPCVDIYLIAAHPQVTRRETLKKDGGVCQGCGIDIKDTIAKLQKRYKRIQRSRCRCVPKCSPWLTYCKKLMTAFIKKHGDPFGNFWQADHIVPLIDGGGFGLDNLQALCHKCHKAKTAIEASARAKNRKAQLSLL